MKEEISLHEWIYNYIVEAILFGIFRQGEQLPAISQFAERFHVSRRPVIHAFKLLEENHYIEMSRGRHSRLILGLNEQDYMENCIHFFLARKEAVQDLCEVRNALLPDLLTQALYQMDEKQCAAIHESIEMTQGEKSAMELVETILSVFGNPLIYSLYTEIALFGRLSFYENMKTFELNGTTAVKDKEQTHAFIDAAYYRKLTYQELYEAIRQYFLLDTRRTQERYDRIPVQTPVEKVEFRWNIYRGRPRLIYNVASAFLKDIIYQVYPVNGRLPRVLDLCEIYQVSEPTLRRAMMILQATGVIEPIGGKGMKVIQCDEHRIHEILKDTGVRERVIEGMQCLHILQLTCQTFTSLSFDSMVQYFEKTQSGIPTASNNVINWIRLICEYCDSIMSVNNQNSLKGIFEELKQHILWVYPFVCHLNTGHYKELLIHIFDILRYAMRNKDEQLYVSEMKYLFYLVLEELRSQLVAADIEAAKSLQMITIKMDI